MSTRIIQGDALTVLRTLPDASVHCVVTSPPYWGLRAYLTVPQVWGGDAECEHAWTKISTKATTGGGIILGVQSAEVAANAITDHLKEKKPLNQYAKNMASINRELLSHWKMRKYFNSLNEQQVNQLFEKLKKANMEEFLAEHGDMDKPTRFIGKMISTPSLWGFAGLAMKFR